MAKRTMWMAALLVAWSSTAAWADQELNVGDPAPKLAVKEFLKGDPVAKLEKGKLYVVEFWATWCGPCRVSIPHLTELQKKYKDVTFIGVSISEHDPKAAKPFVEKMGDKMDYRVAVDDVDGTMSKTWMEAASQEGIPTAFIVNRDDKIAWIGHPMQMDKPLEEITAGKWDLEAASKQFKQEMGPKRKLIALNTKLREASKSGDAKKMVQVLDDAIAEDKDMEPRLGLTKFLILFLKGGDADKTQEYGQRLVDKVLKDNPAALNELAWRVVGADKPTKPDARIVKLALAAALRADDITKHKNPSIVDTLARAYFVSGDAAKALECQEQAMKLAKGTRLEDDKEMQKHLEEYKKAVEKPAGQKGQP
jgi:thiol-disulfide isomerase/thioredoxin